MISINDYAVIIAEEDLIALTRHAERTAYTDLDPADKLIVDAEIEAAEKQAKAIITQKFGKEPTDTDFLEVAMVAGVVYLLSRKPDNQISKDLIDARQEHFFTLLPTGAGSVTQAEVRVSASKMGEWP